MKGESGRLDARHRLASKRPLSPFILSFIILYEYYIPIANTKGVDIPGLDGTKYLCTSVCRGPHAHAQSSPAGHLSSGGEIPQLCSCSRGVAFQPARRLSPDTPARRGPGHQAL